MSLPPDTPQGIADALGYLQHHLHELTERQNVSKNNINTTLAALTTQLQQLTQLVANCKGTSREVLSKFWESVLLVAQWQIVYRTPTVP